MYSQVPFLIRTVPNLVRFVVIYLFFYNFAEILDWGYTLAAENLWPSMIIIAAPTGLLMIVNLVGGLIEAFEFLLWRPFWERVYARR
jgi:hypothetical protein